MSIFRGTLAFDENLIVFLRKHESSGFVLMEGQKLRVEGHVFDERVPLVHVDVKHRVLIVFNLQLDLNNQRETTYRVGATLG